MVHKVQIIPETICFICSSSHGLNPLIYIDEKRTKALELVEEFYDIEIGPNKNCKASLVCNDCIKCIQKVDELLAAVHEFMYKLTVHSGVLETKVKIPLYCHYFLPKICISSQNDKCLIPPEIFANSTSGRKSVLQLRNLPDYSFLEPCEVKEKETSDQKTYSRATYAKVGRLSKADKVWVKEEIKEEIIEFAEIPERSDCERVLQQPVGVDDSLLCSKSSHSLTKGWQGQDLEEPCLFSCTSCERKFATQSSLERHIRLQHENRHVEKKRERRPHGSCPVKQNETFTCKVCKKEMKGNYFRHMSTHDNPRYNCKTCEKQFATVKALENHEKKHSISLVCEKCNWVAPKPSTLKYHMNSVHSNVRSVMCSKCGKTFKTRKDLIRHELTHNKVKPFKCSYCAMTFVENKNRIFHERSNHTGEKPHQCSYCGKCFVKPFQARSHELIHTGEKPYQCTICPKRFRTSNSKMLHMRIHLGVKKFQCKYCSMAFTSRTTLIDHVYIHTGEKPYKCAFCDSCFRQSSSRNGHEKAIHGKVGIHSQKYPPGNNHIKTIMDEELQLVEPTNELKVISRENVAIELAGQEMDSNQLENEEYHVIVTDPTSGEQSTVATLDRMELDQYGFTIDPSQKDLRLEVTPVALADGNVVDSDQILYSVEVYNGQN